MTGVNAKLITWSVVSATLDGFEDYSPMIIAIVEFDNGKRITTQITDVNPKDLTQGIILRPTFRKVYAAGENGVIHYGVKYTI